VDWYSGLVRLLNNRKGEKERKVAEKDRMVVEKDRVIAKMDGGGGGEG
jgi:hypothetical protein